jgi:uncharacterized membrane protein
VHKYISKSLLFPVLLISAPLAIHIAIINGLIAVALLILLLALVLLVSRSWRERVTLGIISIGTVALLSAAGIPGQWLLYTMPTLINLGLAIFFGQSLLANRTPVITRFAKLLRKEMNPRVVVYTRHVTQLWTIFFIALTTESLLLALYAPIETWSLFANFLNYIFTALFFTGEYFFRIHYLDDLEHMSFPRFIQNLSKVDLSDISK